MPLPQGRDSLSSTSIYFIPLLKEESQYSRKKIIIYVWIMRDHPLSLSILLSGGKEIKKDSTSNGEWTWIKMEYAMAKGELLCCHLKNFPGMGERKGWNSRCSSVSRFVPTQSHSSKIECKGVISFIQI